MHSITDIKEQTHISSHKVHYKPVWLFSNLTLEYVSIDRLSILLNHNCIQEIEVKMSLCNIKYINISLVSKILNTDTI